VSEFKLTVEVACGPCDVMVAATGFVTGVAGILVVDPNWECGHINGSWTITHQRSGLAIGYFEEPESAMRCATELEGLTDWTASGSTIVKHLGKGEAMPEWVSRIPIDSDLLASAVQR
jgi:hypothetical protein